MNILGTLYVFELGKLLRKKIIWISFFLFLLGIAFTLCLPLLGNYYVDGKLVDTNYHMFQIDKSYAMALNDREIDQKLIEETLEGYRKIPESGERHYTETEEYQKYARPYSSIFNFITGTTNMQPSEVLSSWQPDEHDLYVKRQIWLKSLWEETKLSAGEMNFWQKQESQIKKPIVYQEHGGYDKLISSYQTIGLFVLLLIAISLSGIFFDEHARKTDQLILCSPFGRAKLYGVKILAGVTFSIGFTVLFLLFAFLLTLYLYGVNGFDAAFQLISRSNSDPISCGQAIFIAYGNMLVTAIFTSIFVMVLSELLHSNIATLAISTGLLIVSWIYTVPAQYRIAAQIWDWLPWGFLSPWNVFGRYTLPINGHYFTAWQAVPVIYLTAGLIIAIIGKPLYRRFQISGR